MICVSISEKNFDKCLELVKSFELCEIRIDLCELTLKQTELIFSSEKNLIATCRPEIVSDEKLRIQLLKTAIKAGAAYVDVEFETSYAFKQEIIAATAGTNCKVIISYHNYQCTPPANELKNIVEQSFDMGADVAKIACMINNPADNAIVLSLYTPGKRIVSIGMGQAGKISRFAAPFLGAEFTFAAPSENEATAPGQMSYKKLTELMRELE